MPDAAFEFRFGRAQAQAVGDAAKHRIHAVWTTSMRAVPLRTEVPMKTQLVRSAMDALSATVPGAFSVG